jgi:hypothetical protein
MGNSKTCFRSRWGLSWKREIGIIEKRQFKLLKTKCIKTSGESSYISLIRAEARKRRIGKEKKGSPERIIGRIVN